MDYLARIELDGAPREGDRAKVDTELAKSDFYFINGISVALWHLLLLCNVS